MSSKFTTQKRNFDSYCNDEKQKLTHLQHTMKTQKRIVDRCKRGSYKYGHDNLSLKDLLEIIAEENKERVIDFIDLFPFSGLKGGSTVNQSLVFEALKEHNIYVLF